MVSKLELKKAVNTLIRRTTIPSRINYRRNIADSIYEAYIFALILKSIKKVGGVVELRSIRNPFSSPPVFIFRGSPGNIHSNSHDYGYAEFTYNGEKYEVHLDVYHEGTSGVRHEVDVSIIDKEHCDNCRRNRKNPQAKHTKAIIECKFYSTTNLRTELIRTFVGLKDDMGSVYIARFCSNKDGENIRKYCSGKENRPRFNGNLVPSSEEENRFVHVLMDDLIKWLG
ncbi:hypothetical protein [Thermaerobacillus caldiproteolyticus]|uniref:Uncharacterized protein n=1 Tax=Thermaerobacillus caldiproteolyticus TaxID=247480 RepID=A0A7V9ZA76_9BACL|nr:hypothetical protein [Anoxybacillus caldiproteolyticus]MBA2876920.1 hypothetical protein [Anoxybacillus caldiproteolyticus]